MSRSILQGKAYVQGGDQGRQPTIQNHLQRFRSFQGHPQQPNMRFNGNFGTASQIPSYTPTLKHHTVSNQIPNYTPALKPHRLSQPSNLTQLITIVNPDPLPDPKNIILCSPSKKSQSSNLYQNITVVAPDPLPDPSCIILARSHSLPQSYNLPQNIAFVAADPPLKPNNISLVRSQSQSPALNLPPKIPFSSQKQQISPNRTTVRFTYNSQSPNLTKPESIPDVCPFSKPDPFNPRLPLANNYPPLLASNPEGINDEQYDHVKYAVRRQLNNRVNVSAR